MEIRRINQSEADLVTMLFDKYRVFYKQQSDIHTVRKFIHTRLANNESAIFVALDNIAGEIIPAGFTQLYPTYSSVRVVKNWILNDLYVDSSYRKQGIGEKLIRVAMKFAKENDAKYVQLETAIDNYTAQSLYERIGFIKQPPDIDYYTYKIAIE